MKRIFMLMIAAMILYSQTASTGEVGFSYSARTGDSSFDAFLSNLNIEAKADMGNFSAKLSLHYGVPKLEVDALIIDVGMLPADAYMTVRVAQLTNNPIDVVVEEYKAHRGKGWGVIAKNLGIKPGSKEFRALKTDDSGTLGKGKGKAHKKKRGK
jgi:hypothetical protein